MELNNCQYYKIDSPIDEIAQIKVNKKNYKLIDNVDKADIIPNILVYLEKEDKRPNYNNISPSVKILITNKYGLINGLWKEIPDYVEYIICDNLVYKNNKDNFDFIEFENEKTKVEIIHKLINQNLINKSNINGETLLHIVCRYNMIDEANEIFKLPNCFSEKIINTNSIYYKISDKTFNKFDNKKRTALYWACKCSCKYWIFKLIDRMSDEAINKDISTIFELFSIVINNTQDTLKLINRIKNETINTCDNDNTTLLHIACYHGNTQIALKLIDLMNVDILLKTDSFGYLAYDLAYDKRMHNVMKKLKEKTGSENYAYYDYV